MCGIVVHLGKLASWSRSGAPAPASPAALNTGEHVVWRFDAVARKNGIKAVRTAIGHDAFVQSFVRARVAEQTPVLAKLLQVTNSVRALPIHGYSKRRSTCDFMAVGGNNVLHFLCCPPLEQAIRPQGFASAVKEGMAHPMLLALAFPPGHDGMPCATMCELTCPTRCEACIRDRVFSRRAARPGPLARHAVRQTPRSSGGAG